VHPVGSYFTDKTIETCNNSTLHRIGFVRHVSVYEIWHA